MNINEQAKFDAWFASWADTNVGHVETKWNAARAAWKHLVQIHADDKLNADRFRFMMRVVDDETGPEFQAMESIGADKFEDSRPKPEQFIELIDAAMDLCAGLQPAAQVPSADRDNVLEEAARICDSVNNHDNPMTARDCADAIRALKTSAATAGGPK